MRLGFPTVLALLQGALLVMALPKPALSGSDRTWAGSVEVGPDFGAAVVSSGGNPGAEALAGGHARARIQWQAPSRGGFLGGPAVGLAYARMFGSGDVHAVRLTVGGSAMWRTTSGRHIVLDIVGGISIGWANWNENYLVAGNVMCASVGHLWELLRGGGVAFEPRFSFCGGQMLEDLVDVTSFEASATLGFRFGTALPAMRAKDP